MTGHSEHMITYNEQSRQFAIQTLATSYFMQVDEEGRLRQLYYGSRIEEVSEVCMGKRSFPCAQSGKRGLKSLPGSVHGILGI